VSGFFRDSIPVNIDGVILLLVIFWVKSYTENLWRIIVVAVGAKNPLLGGVRGGFPYNFVSNATNPAIYPGDPSLKKDTL
jgi:hypothetical protein